MSFEQKLKVFAGIVMLISVPVLFFLLHLATSRVVFGADSGVPFVALILASISVAVVWIAAYVIMQFLDLVSSLLLVVPITIALLVTYRDGGAVWVIYAQFLGLFLVPSLIGADLAFTRGGPVLRHLDRDVPFYRLWRFQLMVGTLVCALSWLVVASNPARHTELHSIAENLDRTNDLEVAKHAIATGVEVDAQKHFGGDTALHIAARLGRVELVRVLLSAGADTEIANDFGRTPLHEAARRSEALEVLELLIGANASVNARDGRGRTPLHAAAGQSGSEKNDNQRIVQALIAAGAEINTRAESGATALHDAAWNNTDPRIAEALIEAGADLEVSYGINREKPLHIAASFGTPDVVDVLLRAGANVNSHSKANKTPLHSAARRFSLAKQPLDSFEALTIVRSLVTAGGQANHHDALGLAPLDVAFARGGGTNLERVFQLNLGFPAELNATVAGYDGVWIGTAIPTSKFGDIGDPCQSAQLIARIQAGVVNGIVDTQTAEFLLAGKIVGDNSFNGHVLDLNDAVVGWLNGAIVSDKFTGRGHDIRNCQAIWSLEQK